MTDYHNLEQLSQEDLARFALEVVRRTILHYGIWFNETLHQLGLEEAIKVEGKVFPAISPIVIKRLSQVLGFEVENDLPVSLLRMPKQKLISLIDAMSINWLANDGIWFQTVETRHDMYTAKRCNDTCWSRFSPLEASMIKSFIGLPERGGLEALEQALAFRLYARINKQTTERDGNTLIFRMTACRVQDARKRKGMEDYPCKSGGTVEYATFAHAIDPRIKTECIACPPDQHPVEWLCAWKFYLEK